MKVLFIHQNFPGQYLHLARHLHKKGHQVIGLGETANIKRRGTLPDITTVGYATPKGAGANIHHYLTSTEAAVRRGQTVARSLIGLKEKGLQPDVISVHPGWGEALFVRDVFPDTPILMFCEYFFHAGEADIGFDPEFPVSADTAFSVRVRNAPQLVSLATADACVCPTKWQASRYPAGICKHMQVIHDGVNIDYMKPGDDSLTLLPKEAPGEYRVLLASERAQIPDQEKLITLTKADKVISYMARNLEPYRGFHMFSRALPAIQKKHPDARILIIGSDGVSYSPALANEETYKAKYMAELEGKVDLSRIHFVGRIPYEALRSIFRITSAHVYLTYPFVLSWSVMEAMACETLLVASATEPVREVIKDRKNGLLFGFFKQDELLGAIDEALASPDNLEAIRKKARQSILTGYKLEDCLDKHVGLLETMAAGKYKGAWRKG